MALAALLGGCGDDELTYPNTTLGGNVSVEGNPIPVGIISFLSLDQKYGQLIKTSIIRGRYIAEKIPLGKVLVVINAEKATGRMITANGQSFPETVSMIPSKYLNKGFELDVKEVTSRVDFEMKEDSEPRPTPSEVKVVDSIKGEEAQAVPRPALSEGEGAGSDTEKRVPESPPG